MSLKTLLMPVVSQHLLSERRVRSQRARVERLRLRAGQGHVLHYFHQVDDPYSALAAHAVTQLLARYDVAVQLHVVGPPDAAAAPERDKLVAYSRKDAHLLAQHYGLDFVDPGVQPGARAVEWASRLLVAAVDDPSSAELLGAVSQWLWKNPAGTRADAVAQGRALASTDAVAAHLQGAEALRHKLGHYLGATFYYGGEWYWGIDRLYHLEQRLQALGAGRPSTVGYLFPPSQDLARVAPSGKPTPIDFFFSLRSPYSALVAPRIFELGRLTGAEVRLRFLLPMVMRGLPVPKAKRSYIALDAAREARARSIPFGRINDPVGRPTERGLALIPYAERAGKGQAYVLSFMQGVWAEGLDAGSDRGLRRIAERAGMPWQQAREALHDGAWRERAEANRLEMFGLGLWGVPSFRVGGTAVWGQDRLWAVQDALLGAGPRA